MSRLPWFKCFPSKLLGALSGMSSDEGYLYVTILLRIYESGGPIADTARILSRRTGIPERRVEVTLASLEAMDKIQIAGGRIDSFTTHEGLAEQDGVKNAGKIGGLASAKKRGEKAEQIHTLSSTAVDTPLNGHATIKDLDTEKKERNLTVSCPKRVRTRNEYPSEFEEFWQGFPTDKLMSKKVAYDVWKRLGPDDHASAVASLPAFRAYCLAHPDYRVVHACRYLSQRRFDGFLEIALKTAAQVLVKPNTPQWKAWDAWWHEHKGKPMPFAEKAKGWYCDSEWPPTEAAA